MEALMFLSIFGGLLILCSWGIASSEDPRKLPFFTAIHPITHMSLCDAKKEAIIIAECVRLIGLTILIICFICFLI